MHTLTRSDLDNPTPVSRASVPWIMAAARMALGPILIAGAVCGWSPFALAAMVVAALLSDIFDGVLARRWGCDTAGVRRFDSLADTVFYLAAAAALWLAHPGIFRANARLMEAVLALELLRAAFEIAKFGKPASYHSYLAKAWGLVMAIAVTSAFATGWGRLLPVALAMGIACNLQGLAMSAMLPVWRRDVKGLSTALKLRNDVTRDIMPR